VEKKKYIVMFGFHRALQLFDGSAVIIQIFLTNLILLQMTRTVPFSALHDSSIEDEDS